LDNPDNLGLSDKGIRGGNAQENDREEESEKGPQGSAHRFGESGEETRQTASEIDYPSEQGEGEDKEDAGQILPETGKNGEIKDERRNGPVGQKNCNTGEGKARASCSKSPGGRQIVDEAPPQRLLHHDRNRLSERRSAYRPCL
jgi:hypothetical protein